ncbi:magnesium chelatase [Prauserella cavernicola]|uniref:Magnesium chelatase n=1 Tax=Prauserella cavernicola TaxID=2800127 RepID=A0A934V546_9PSEU|nr:magnesium chelatase [Prauserella cavernicola]MBK1784780.1 magnesium chelatase [Prauserella cavernicola]
MDNLDISVLVNKISDHRYDGYTDNMLADEIDRFRSGPGISGISDAVEALMAIGGALAETDGILRTELAKLGVEWQSEAGAQAGAAVARNADFSTQAGERVDDSAKRIFAQGESFNRTLHKLPDSEALRQSAGYGVFDGLGSLLGFETDNAVKVAQAREARQQALEALNAYAQDSGEHLNSTPSLASPQTLHADTGPRLPGRVDAGGGPDDVTAAAGLRGPIAAAPGSVPGSPPPTAAPPVSGASAYAPTPAYGLPAQQPPPSRSTGSGNPVTRPVPQSTSASSAAPAPAPAPSGYVGGVRAPQQHQSGSVAVPPSAPAAPGGSGSPIAPGSTTPPAVPPVAGGVVGGTQSPGTAVPPGAGAGSGPGTPGRVGGVVGGPVTGGAPGAGGVPAASTPPPAAGSGGVAGGVGGVVGKPGVPGGGGDDQPLAKGKSFGSAPQPGSQPGTVTSGGFTGTPKGGAPLNDVGAGAAALGAGGVAGALAGDNERKGRGVGRSAPGSTRSPHQLAIGDLPEEEARAQRNSDRLSPRSERQRAGYLEKAAPQDEGEEDASHVRRYGVDDNDLFTDQRMVSPDVIGDDADGHK